jgi:hypothetical protein
MKKEYLIYILLLFCSQLQAQQQLTKVEYFVDADPGYGLGVDVPFTAGTTLDVNFSISLPSSVSVGFHYVTVRVKNVINQWSAVLTRPFLKESLVASSLPNLIAMEYFIDNDPGYGAATALVLTAGLTISQDLNISLGSLANGVHKLSIRAKNANNSWSLVGIRDFVVQDNIVVAGTTPASWCKNTSFSIPFTATGTYNAGNVFTAQLSDALGSFASPTSLGTITSTSSGTITATIPNTIALGTGYKIRNITGQIMQ